MTPAANNDFGVGLFSGVGEQMRDVLLARADRAIRESQLVREWAHQDRLNARGSGAGSRNGTAGARRRRTICQSLSKDGKLGCAVGKNKPIGCLSPNTDFENGAQSYDAH